MNDKLIEQIKSILSQFFDTINHINNIKFKDNEVTLYSNFNYFTKYTFNISDKHFKMINGLDKNGIRFVDILINIDENLRYINESLKYPNVTTTVEQFYFYDNTLISTDDIKEYKINRNLKLLNKV